MAERIQPKCSLLTLPHYFKPLRIVLPFDETLNQISWFCYFIVYTCSNPHITPLFCVF